MNADGHRFSEVCFGLVVICVHVRSSVVRLDCVRLFPQFLMCAIEEESGAAQSLVGGNNCLSFLRPLFVCLSINLH